MFEQNDFELEAGLAVMNLVNKQNVNDKGGGEVGCVFCIVRNGKQNKLDPSEYTRLLQENLIIYAVTGQFTKYMIRTHRVQHTK